MIVITDNHGIILSIRENKLPIYDENTYNINTEEQPVLVFKDYTRQFEVSEIPTEVQPYTYTYSEEDGFKKIEIPEEPKTEEEIIQEYRDKLAQEVSGNVDA